MMVWARYFLPRPNVLDLAWTIFILLLIFEWKNLLRKIIMTLVNTASPDTRIFKQINDAHIDPQ